MGSAEIIGLPKKGVNDSSIGVIGYNTASVWIKTGSYEDA